MVIIIILDLIVSGAGRKNLFHSLCRRPQWHYTMDQNTQHISQRTSGVSRVHTTFAAVVGRVGKHG